LSLFLFALSVVQTVWPGTYNFIGLVPKQFVIVVAFATGMAVALGTALIWPMLIPGWICLRREAWAIYMLL